MKPFPRSLATALGMVVILVNVQEASAQLAPAMIHGDAAGTIGWLAADANEPGQLYYDNWVNSLFAAGSVGWHWSDNLKTEVDFGAGTDSRTFRPEQMVNNGRTTYYTIESHRSRRTLGISGQYQFFHNVWFHPHVAAGANVTWEHQTEEPEPIYFSDAAANPSSILQSVRSEATETSLEVNPFLAVGYKAYMTDRAFFRNDLRVAFRGGPHEAVLRFGFGFDF